jgi:hypothetical protein
MGLTMLRKAAAATSAETYGKTWPWLMLDFSEEGDMFWSLRGTNQTRTAKSEPFAPAAVAAGAPARIDSNCHFMEYQFYRGVLNNFTT